MPSYWRGSRSWKRRCAPPTWPPQFAILTRAGIDARWHQRPGHVDTVVVFDLDQVHGHNAHWGYAETDSRIATVMAQVGDNWIFRWFSGDEFGLRCPASDALGFARNCGARRG